MNITGSLICHTNGQWALSPAFFISCIPKIFTVFTTICVLGLNFKGTFNYIVISICHEYLRIFLALFSFKGFPWNSQEQHSYTSIYKFLYTLNALQMNHKLHSTVSSTTLWNYSNSMQHMHRLKTFVTVSAVIPPRFPSVFFTSSYCSILSLAFAHKWGTRESDSDDLWSQPEPARTLETTT